MFDQPNESKFKELMSYIDQHPEIERFEFNEPVRSVQEAIDASGFEKSEFIKSICLKHKSDERFVVAIIPAGSRVDKTSLIEGVNPKKWKMASYEEVYHSTGFPAGGVPPVCLDKELIRFVDPRVVSKDFIVGGGGTQQSLLRMPSKLILESGAIEKIVSFG